MTTEKIESVVKRRGTEPVLKETLRANHEFYYSEGYSSPPHLKWQTLGAGFKGVDPGDYPYGMYAAVYFFDIDKRKLGSVNFYCAKSTSQKSRIEDTRNRARMELHRLLSARRDRGVAN